MAKQLAPSANNWIHFTWPRAKVTWLWMEEKYFSSSKSHDQILYSCSFGNENVSIRFHYFICLCFCVCIIFTEGPLEEWTSFCVLLGRFLLSGHMFMVKRHTSRNNCGCDVFCHKFYPRNIHTELAQRRIFRKPNYFYRELHLGVNSLNLERPERKMTSWTVYSVPKLHVVTIRSEQKGSWVLFKISSDSSLSTGPPESLWTILQFLFQLPWPGRVCPLVNRRNFITNVTKGSFECILRQNCPWMFFSGLCVHFLNKN